MPFKLLATVWQATRLPISVARLMFMEVMLVHPPSAARSALRLPPPLSLSPYAKLSILHGTAHTTSCYP